MRNSSELETLSLYHKILLTECPSQLCQKIRFRADVHNIAKRFRGFISPPVHHLLLFQRSLLSCIYSKYNKYINLLLLFVSRLGFIFIPNCSNILKRSAVAGRSYLKDLPLNQSKPSWLIYADGTFESVFVIAYN